MITVELTPLHERAIEAVALVIWGHSPLPTTDNILQVFSRRCATIGTLWLGHLEAVNDTTLAGIVEAARTAEALACRRHGLHDDPCPCVCIACAAHHIHDPSVLFAALAVEGIAEGSGTCDCARSWFAEHARFDLNGREFIIPALRIGGAE